MKNHLLYLIFILVSRSLLAQLNFVSSYTTTTSNFKPFVSADFNNDGKHDLLVGDSNGQVKILLGNGAGSFSSMTALPAGTNAADVCITDLNGDSRPDIIAIISSDIGVFLSIGSGFQPVVSYSAGPTARSLAAADFNGDGKMDIACSNWGSNTISIFSGDGTGLLSLAGTYTAAAGPICIKAVDVNKDNKPDLVSANSWAFNVSVLINNGSGGFMATTSYTLPFNAYGVDIADLDMDGNTDMVAFVYSMSGTNSNRLFVLKGNGDGTFQPCVGYDSGGTSGLIADFDADGKKDVATTSNQGAASALIFFKGNGDGSFGSASGILSSVSGSEAICSADFDGDGKADLACVNQSVMEVFLSRIGPVGLKEETSEQKLFQLYPNPSSGEFFLDSSEKMEISIMDGLGKTIYHSQIEASSQDKISLDNKPAGVYFLTGKAKQCVETKKIIIIH